MNIALVNELALIFDTMNIPTNEVLKARYKMELLNFKPGLVGGHCIGVDSYYSPSKLRKWGINPTLFFLLE